MLPLLLTLGVIVGPHGHDRPIATAARLQAPIINETITKLYEVTAYTAGAESTGKTPAHPAYGITASGERVKAGYSAACPPELPFGTRLRIEGLGERVCVDRGGAIKGARLDVYMPELDDAIRFGRRTLEVEVISKGER